MRLKRQYIAIVATTVVVGLATYAVIGQSPDLELIGIILNATLTLALLWVYTDMSATQSQQRGLMEEQKNISSRQLELQSENQSARQMPVIERGPLEAEGDSLHVSLINSGNGPAYNLRIRTEVISSNIESLEGVSIETAITKNVEQGPDELQMSLEMGNALHPSEGRQHFSTRPQLAIRTVEGGKIHNNFSEEFAKILDEYESVDADIHISLVWDGMHDHQGELHLSTIHLSDIDFPMPFHGAFYDYGIDSSKRHSEPAIN